MGNTGRTNGNGGIHDNYHDDDDDTPAVNPLGNRENRRMMTILADYLTEAKTHTAKLESLYVALKELTAPASPIWAGQLLTEFERHHEAEGQNLDTLRVHIQDQIGGSHSASGDTADDED